MTGLTTSREQQLNLACAAIGCAHATPTNDSAHSWIAIAHAHMALADKLGEPAPCDQPTTNPNQTDTEPTYPTEPADGYPSVLAERVARCDHLVSVIERVRQLAWAERVSGYHSELAVAILDATGGE